MRPSKIQGFLVGIILGSLLLSALIMIAITSFASSSTTVGMVGCGVIIAGAITFVVIRAHQHLPENSLLTLKLKYTPIVLIIFGILMAIFPLWKNAAQG